VITGAGEASPLDAGAVAADGSTSAFVTRIATAGCDNKVRVYRRDTRAGAGVASPATSAGGSGGWVLEDSLPGHTQWVRDVAWAPSSGLAINTLASCSDDGTVLIWRQAAAGGRWAAEALPQFPAPVWRLSFSVAGNLLAVSCGDNSVTIWKESLSGPWQQVSTVPDPSLPAAPIARAAAAGAGAY